MDLKKHNNLTTLNAGFSFGVITNSGVNTLGFVEGSSCSLRVVTQAPLLDLVVFDGSFWRKSLTGAGAY